MSTKPLEELKTDLGVEAAKDETEVAAAPDPVAEVQAAPDSLPNPTSHVDAVIGGPTQPSLDTDKFDDFGHAKDETEVAMGPRGKNRPGDSMLAEERAAIAKAATDKEKALYAPTAAHDSRGNQKGTFEITPQGNNAHGMRIPDKVDYFKRVEPPSVLGPRGTNLPKDCFTE